MTVAKGLLIFTFFSTTILSPLVVVGLLTTKICSVLSLQGSGLYLHYLAHTIIHTLLYEYSIGVCGRHTCVYADRKPEDNTQWPAPCHSVLFL